MDNVPALAKQSAGRPPAITRSMLSKIVELKSLGYANVDIARLFNVSPPTVSRALRSPEAIEEMEDLRLTFRVALSERVPGLVKKVADAVEQAETAKDVDAASRALMNLEKTSASVSGEAKKVELTGTEGQPLQIDVRAILARVTDPA
jgi:predicted transcriptional regulator